MIIRNCSELLNDLVELENQISKLEKALKKNCPDLDLEEALKITFNLFFEFSIMAIFA